MPRLVRPEEQQEICCFPDCTRPPGADLKGLCMPHYSEAKKMVANKTITWEKLFELGLVKRDKTEFELEVEKRIAGGEFPQ